MVIGRARFEVVIALALAWRARSRRSRPAWTSPARLSRDGHVRCWGDNALGRITGSGRGRPADCFGEAYLDEIEFPGRCSPRPQAVEGLDQVRQLAAASPLSS